MSNPQITVRPNQVGIQIGVSQPSITVNPKRVEVVAIEQDATALAVAKQGPAGPPGQSDGGGSASTEISGSQQLAANQVYLVNGDSLQLLNLPLTANVDDAITLYGTGTGLFRITQNAGQYIRFNDALSTIGVAGKIEATNANCFLKLIYVGASSWLVDAAIGNFEVS